MLPSDIDQENHEMIFSRNEDGSIEWYCPTCGRKIGFWFSPKRMKVLSDGNVYANHFGSSGGLMIHSTSVQQEGDEWMDWADKHKDLLDGLGETK